MKKELIPYYIDECSGKLMKYPNERIKISGHYYSIITRGQYEELPQFRIDKLNRIRYTDGFGIKIREPFVYRLREEGNNGSEICISLSIWQNILFNLPFVWDMMRIFVRKKWDSILRLALRFFQLF